MILLPAAARFWAASIGGLVLVAALIAMLSGLLLSFHFCLPSGQAIILVAGVAYTASLFLVHQAVSS
jgi:zinc/manganese transport system permease protein